MEILDEPLTETPFSAAEMDILEDELRREKREFPGLMLATIGLAGVIPLFPSRSGEYKGFMDWPDFKAGYLKRFALYLIFVLPFFLWKSISRIRRLKRDLRTEVKNTAAVQVRRKVKAGDRFTILLDSKEADFKKFRVTVQDYDALSVGDRVILEFAPRSKYLFKPHWTA